MINEIKKGASMADKGALLASISTVESPDQLNNKQGPSFETFYKEYLEGMNTEAYQLERKLPKMHRMVGKNNAMDPRCTCMFCSDS